MHIINQAWGYSGTSLSDHPSLAISSPKYRLVLKRYLWLRHTVYSLSYNILLFCKTLEGCYSSGHTTFTPGQFTPPSELFTVALVSVWKEAPEVWRNCSRHFGNGCIVLPSCLTLMASFTQEWIRNFQTVLDRLKTNHISLFDTRTAQKPNEIIKL